MKNDKKTTSKAQKTVKTVFAVLVTLALLCAVYAVTINFVVKFTVSDRVIDADAAAALGDVDCILVLGCQVKSGGVPSDMLADRIATGVTLFEAGVSDVLLMSGDHREDNYNEVGTMKRVAMESGVPEVNIELDGMGLSTYESVWRAVNTYGYKRIVIVTQEYHLYRALYVARSLGAEAWGVSADLRSYKGHLFNLAREMVARNKDFIYTRLAPTPTSTQKAD